MICAQYSDSLFGAGVALRQYRNGTMSVAFDGYSLHETPAKESSAFVICDL